MVSASVASRIASRYGASSDEIMAVMDDVPDELAQAKFLEETTGVERVAHTGAGTLFDQPARIASETLSTGQKTLLGGGAIAGGTYLGSRAFDTGDQWAAAQETKEQSEALSQILNSPNLSDKQRQELVDQLVNRGFFDEAGVTDDEGDGGVIDRLLGDLSLVQYSILLFVLYFAGKTAVAAASGGNN